MILHNSFQSQWTTKMIGSCFIEDEDALVPFKN